MFSFDFNFKSLKHVERDSTRLALIPVLYQFSSVTFYLKKKKQNKGQTTP
jgi:hypothetical protein